MGLAAQNYPSSLKRDENNTLQPRLAIESWLVNGNPVFLPLKFQRPAFCMKNKQVVDVGRPDHCIFLSPFRCLSCLTSFFTSFSSVSSRGVTCWKRWNNLGSQTKLNKSSDWRIVIENIILLDFPRIFGKLSSKVKQKWQGFHFYACFRMEKSSRMGKKSILE